MFAWRPWIGHPLAVLGVAAVVVVGTDLVDVTPSTRGLLAAGASVLAIGGLYAAPTGPAARLLALPIPRYLGQVSYGTYLWHWPVILVARQLFDVGPWVLAALAAPVATGLAALSYEVLERPIRRARPLDAYRWPVVGAGLAASVLAATLVLPPVLHSSVRPSVANPSAGDLSAISAAAAWVDDPVPADLDLPAALADVPDAGTPCTPDDLEVCVRVTGAGPRVLLVGDSQSAMFVTAFETLAREKDFTLVTNVLRGCGWESGLSPRCVAEQDVFYRDVLPALDVDVVVAVSLSRAEPEWQETYASPDRPPGETLAQLHLRTSTATVDLVHAAGAKMIIVKALLGTNGYEQGGSRPARLPGPRLAARRLRARAAAGEAVHRRHLRHPRGPVAGRHRDRRPRPGVLPRLPDLPAGHRRHRRLEGPRPRHRHLPRRPARADLVTAGHDRDAGAVSGSGTKDDPWQLTTAPGRAATRCTATRRRTHRPGVPGGVDDAEVPPQRGRRPDAWLRDQGDWVPLGAADEQKDAAAGTVEAWGRDAGNPVGGWYGLRKGYRGRFGMYLPPLLEELGLAELTHEKRNNQVRAV